MRFKPSQIDTTGATDGDGLVYDQPSDSYVPGPSGGSSGRYEVLVASDGSGAPILASGGSGDWLYGKVT